MAIEKYWGIFPTVLFSCSDFSNQMHFILLLKTRTKKQFMDLIELVEHCGAETSCDLNDATDFSVIIVDHDDVVNFHAPAFKLKFIEDSLYQKKLLDISKYRQDATKHIAEGFSCMDVVYFRKLSWNEVLTEEEKHWFDTNCNKEHVEDQRGDVSQEPRTFTFSMPDYNVNGSNANFNKNLNNADKNNGNSENSSVGTCSTSGSSGNKRLVPSAVTDTLDLFSDDSDMEDLLTYNKAENASLKNRTTPTSEENEDVEAAARSVKSTNATPSLVSKWIHKDINNKIEEDGDSSSRKHSKCGQFSKSASSKTFYYSDDSEEDSNDKTLRKLTTSKTPYESNANFNKNLNNADKNNGNPKKSSVGTCSESGSSANKRLVPSAVTDTIDLFSDDSDMEDLLTYNKGENASLKNRTTPTSEENEDIEAASTSVKSTNTTPSLVSKWIHKDINNKIEENGDSSSRKHSKCGQFSKSASSKTLYYSDDSEEDSNDKTLRKLKTSKTPDERSYSNDSEEESNDKKLRKLKKPKKPDKHSRQPYSVKERSRILAYIVEHNEFGRIKGREMWQILERRKVCPSRTWQSMKEHFLKKILMDLDSYSFLTNEDKRKIKKCCYT